MIPRDEVLRMWKQAQHPDLTDEDIAVRFAALVAAAENEACARVCDGVESDRWDCYKGRGNHERFSTGRANPVVEGAAEGASLCAAAIRARGK